MRIVLEGGMRERDNSEGDELCQGCDERQGSLIFGAVKGAHV